MENDTVFDSIARWIVALISTSRISYFWSGLTGVMSILSIQEWCFILGAIFSAYMTYKTYRANLKEQEHKKEQETKRTKEIEKQTAIIAAYLEQQSTQTTPPIIDVTKAIRKADAYTSDNAIIGGTNEKSPE